MYKTIDKGGGFKCLAIRRNSWKKLMQGQNRRLGSEYKSLISKFEQKVLIEFLNKTYFQI